MASVRKTRLSPYWQAVLTLKDGTRTNRSTKQIDKAKANEVALEMQRTINAALKGSLSQEKLLRTFHALLNRIGEQPLSKTPKTSGLLRGQYTEEDMLKELRQRLRREKLEVN